MKRNILAFLMLAVGAILGYFIPKDHSETNKDTTIMEETKDTTSQESTGSQDTTPRVTGVGGIFFKSKDPAATRAWYEQNLGFKTGDYGTNFEWYQGDDSTRKGFTLWSPFTNKTTYFDPSESEYMINYRVHNLDALLVQLKAAGVTITDEVQAEEYGKFVHIMDPEGRKIELWEPVDEEYDKIIEARTK